MNDIEQLKDNFLSKINEKKTQQLSEKENKFRLCTYNIHYFTDLSENNKYNEIIEDISKIDADVIGLQEFVLGNEIKINDNTTLTSGNFFNDMDNYEYYKSSVCNSVPSWYNSIYGNITLVKNQVTCHAQRGCELLCNKDRACEDLNEEIYTFPKATKTVRVSGSHEGKKETRCYIKIKLTIHGKSIYIYNTHLDVASEDTRLGQIKEILKDTSKLPNNSIIFIMGDFNTINIDVEKKISSKFIDGNKFLRENGDVIKELLKEKFYDMHHENHHFTAWNNVKVDFIFCNINIPKKYITAEYLYTTNSDHIPVILSIKKDFFDEDTRQTGGKSRKYKKVTKRRPTKRRRHTKRRRPTKKRKLVKKEK